MTYLEHTKNTFQVHALALSERRPTGRERLGVDSRCVPIDNPPNASQESAASRF